MKATDLVKGEWYQVKDHRGWHVTQFGSIQRWERLKRLWRAQQAAERQPDDPLAIARLQRAVEAAR
jgi:hypothetical protein